MFYRIAADLVVLVHLLFVVYATLGAVAALKWPRSAWMHLPAAAWAVMISFYGWICPLTPLEMRLRRRAGEGGYSEGFVEHYLLPLLYPGDMTRGIQVALGGFVLVVNLVLYIWIVRRTLRAR